VKFDSACRHRSAINRFRPTMLCSVYDFVEEFHVFTLSDIVSVLFAVSDIILTADFYSLGLLRRLFRRHGTLYRRGSELDVNSIHPWIGLDWIGYL